jgi:hypothetical protein
MFTNAKKLESTQQKFTALLFNHFFPHVHCSYADSLGYLRPNTLRMAFMPSTYSDLFASKFCSSIRKLLVCPVYRDFSAFIVCSTSKFCLLDSLQLLMLFARLLIYLKPIFFLNHII